MISKSIFAVLASMAIFPEWPAYAINHGVELAQRVGELTEPLIGLI